MKSVFTAAIMSEAGDMGPASKKVKKDLPGGDFDLGDLPDLPLLEIAKNLNLEDLVSFSHASSRVWRLMGKTSAIWSKVLKNLNFPCTSRLEGLASSFSTLFPASCEEKIRLLTYVKTKNNWESGNITPVLTTERDVFGARSDTLFFGSGGGVTNDLSDGIIWDFIIPGPRSFVAWTSHQSDDSHDLDTDDIFIFNDTVCLFFYTGGPRQVLIRLLNKLQGKSRMPCLKYCTLPHSCEISLVTR